MNTCYNMNIIVQTTDGYAYYLGDKIKITNNTLSDITRALLLNSSHKKYSCCFYISMPYGIFENY